MRIEVVRNSKLEQVQTQNPYPHLRQLFIEAFGSTSGERLYKTYVRAQEDIRFIRVSSRYMENALNGKLSDFRIVRNFFQYIFVFIEIPNDNVYKAPNHKTYYQWGDEWQDYMDKHLPRSSAKTKIVAKEIKNYCKKFLRVRGYRA